MLHSLHSRLVSGVLAGGLVLGSAGLALAQPPLGDANHRPAAPGTVVATITNPGAMPAASTDDPFALYRRPHDPSNAGTAVTDPGIPSAANPFALYRRAQDPSNAGRAIDTSHVATARDDAISRVNPDPFR
jgi:hypothetical protein